MTNQTIGEGEMGEAIYVKATAPPYVLCRGKLEAIDQCSIQVKFSFEETSTATFCPNGEHTKTKDIFISPMFFLM